MCITCAKIAHKSDKGKQIYNTKYYDLDMIISMDFRVNSENNKILNKNQFLTY